MNKIETDGIIEDDEVEYCVERLSDTGINISHLFVPYDERGRNKGSQKMEEILRKADNDPDIEYVAVNIGSGEKSASFLRKFGFEITELEPDHVTGMLELSDWKN